MRRFPALLCLLWAVIWASLGVYGAVSNPRATSFTIQGPDATGNLGFPVAVVQATGSSWPFSGSLTNNNAAPGANNIGVLGGLANAAAPTWTEGDQVLFSADLSGRQRVTGAGGTFPVTSASLTTGTPADAFAAPGAIEQAQAFPQVWNGATWDRVYGANAAATTTGTGLLGVGSLLFDGTNWQKPKTAYSGTGAVSNSGVPEVQLMASSSSGNVQGIGTAGLVGDNTAGGNVLATLGLMKNASGNYDRLVGSDVAPTTTKRLAVSVGTGNMTSLSAVTGTGAGTAFNLGTAAHEFGVQVTTTGGPASVSVTLQGSLDAGTTWTNIGSAITGTGASLTFFTGSPVTDVRLNLGTFSGGTSPTLTGIVCAY